MEVGGQLTGGLAYDFNNLLQAVHGNLDLIRSKPTDQEQVARLAQNGMLAAERGTKLTAQLLASLGLRSWNCARPRSCR
jgi:hypothetical protein